MSKNTLSNVLNTYAFIASADFEGYISRFAQHPDLASGDGEELIWIGATAYPFPTTAVSLEVLSDDADDDDQDTGAWTVQVIGLDENWEPQTATITLNGTSAVAVPGSWIRVNRAKVLTAGSSGWNEGEITIRRSSGGATQAIIEATRNQTQVALHTVPAGYVGYIIGFNAQVDSGAGSGCVLQLKTRDNTVENGVFRPLTNAEAHRDSPVVLDFAYPIHVGERTDIAVTGIAEGNGMRVTCRMDLLIVKKGR